MARRTRHHLQREEFYTLGERRQSQPTTYGQIGQQHRDALLERPCAHLYETGGLQRAHVRGHENVLKRLLVHAGGLQSRTVNANTLQHRHATQPPRPPDGRRSGTHDGVEPREPRDRADQYLDRLSETLGATGERLNCRRLKTPLVPLLGPRLKRGDHTGSRRGIAP